ncbi:MAG: GGDEF domain-containing protein [Campylobacterota bacterium]|nr:GGDEF domain-containing protein [Campylobacterota bacterium]
MKQKVLSKLILIMIIVGITLAIFESYNFRKYGIQTAMDKAQSISEVVKSGLTSHMINGNMDQRGVFLNSISNLENVKQLWIIRGENVIKQYGPAKPNEQPQDDIDKQVLKNSKIAYTLDESFSKSTIRVTIPYKAIQNKTANCMECHDVKYGETLGAISIILDITEMKNSGLFMAFLIMVFTAIATILVIFFASRILKPHLETIDELSGKVKNISNGTFTNMIKKDGISKESDNLIREYNILVNGLSTTFSDIDKKLNIFVGDNPYHSQNPLINSQRVIGNLSDIYQFKKEIEIDSTKDEIYERLSQILQNKFDFHKFIFMEQNYETNKNIVVYKQGNCDYCSKELTNSPELCRVIRSTNDVTSLKDHKVCTVFNNDQKHYYCTFIDIGDNVKLVINFTLDTKDELSRLKDEISLIRNYFLESAPSLIVKLLLEELKASAYKDGLTGLYNRKFLDEHIEKLVPHALRENINLGVLMLDMDHFKAVNDEYGHDVGDLVLKELSRILGENVRDSDIVVRYGGEEFVVLLVGVTDEQKALEVANKIKTKVSENEISVYAGNKLKKTVSIGLSMFPQDSRNFETVMKNADIALYEAKSSGRNKAIRWEDKVEIELF